MISGLWANTNLDDGKQTRQNALRQIENDHQNTIHEIYLGKDEEIDYEQDPFFAAMKLDGEEKQDETVNHDLKTDLEIDQA
jgi:hypothetical protein